MSAFYDDAYNDGCDYFGAFAPNSRNSVNYSGGNNYSESEKRLIEEQKRWREQKKIDEERGYSLEKYATLSSTSNNPDMLVGTVLLLTKEEGYKRKMNNWVNIYYDMNHPEKGIQGVPEGYFSGDTIGEELKFAEGRNKYKEKYIDVHVNIYKRNDWN